MLFVLPLCRNVSVPVIVVFAPLPPSSGSWMEEGQLTRQGRQTNKQTNKEIKIEKKRAGEMWWCFYRREADGT